MESGSLIENLFKIRRKGKVAHDVSHILHFSILVLIDQKTKKDKET